MKKPRVFYGYWILAACFLFLAIGVGCSQVSFSFFIKPLQAEMGWSRTEIMAAFTIYTMCMGLTGPLVGRLVDRYGPRKIIPISALVVASGFITLSLMGSLIQFYIGYALIGLGTTGMGPVALTCLVSYWFSRRRGMAIGIMSTGMSIGGTVFAPIIAVYLIPSLSLSHAYLTLGLILGTIIVAVSLAVVRNRPADMGLLPDGLAAEETGSEARRPSDPEEGLSLKMALAAPVFWLLAVAMILHHSHMGVGQSVVPHLGDIGFPVAIAASAASTTALMGLAGMFFFGWLCDRIPVKFAYVIGLVFIVIGIVVLLNIGAGSPVWMVWLYAAPFGFGASSWMPTMAMIVSTTFGMASYGTIFGMLNLFQSLGGAAGPLLAGYIFDSSGSYFWAFILILAFEILAMPLVLSVRRPASYKEDNSID